MEYHINNEAGDTIASFLYESDRDYYLEMLQDLYGDCEFAAIDGEAT